MAVDPNIALQSQGLGPLANPLEQAQQIQTMRVQQAQAAAQEELRQATAEQRQQQADKLTRANAAQDAFARALQQGKGIRGASLDYATQNEPTAVPLLTDYFDKTEKSAAEIGKLKTDVAEKTNTLNNAYLDHVGLAADTALKYANGDPAKLSGALATVTAHYGEQFPDEKDRALQTYQQLAALPPDQQMQALQRMRDAAPSFRAQAAELAKPRDVGGRLVTMNPDGTPKVLLDKPDEHSAAYKEWQDANADRHARGIPPIGFEDYQNQDANRRRPVVNVSAGGATPDDPKAIASAIISGDQPPDLHSLYRMAGPIRAELARQGYNLTQATTDWQATTKHIATLNGAQQTRLNQSINALPDMLDSVDALASKWKAGKFPILNKANLALAKNGALGKDAASIANQLSAQIADVTADLGNVYMGGNSPTDHALGLAAQSLSADWDEKVLHDMVGLARKNVTIRQNSIRNTPVQGASGNNPYAPPVAPAPSAAGGAITVTDPKGGVHTFPTQAAADAFKKAAGIQ